MTAKAVPSFIEASRLRSTVFFSTSSADYTKRRPGFGFSARRRFLLEKALRRR
jgi:hypothetical protein